MASTSLDAYSKRILRSSDPYQSVINPGYKPTPRDRAELLDLFGKLPTDMSVDNLYSQPQAYSTINDVLAERLATRTKERIYGLLKDNFWSPWTSYLYPITQMPEGAGTDIEWDSFKFDQGLMSPLAPLGVPRIFEHTRTRHQARMERFGSAIFMEATGWKTPEGRRMWGLQIAQLAAITQRTFEEDVALEITQAWVGQPKRAFQLGVNSVDGTSGNSYRDFLKTDCELFGLVNKTPDSRGLINTVDRFHQMMRLFNDGSEPDTLLFPPNMRRFYMFNNSDRWTFNVSGISRDRAERDVELAKPSSNGISLVKFMDFVVVDTQIYRSTTQSAHEAGDILTTRRQIGEWYPLCIHDEFPEPEDMIGGKYTTRSRNISIHNEDHDRFAVISLRDAIRNCFRFKEDGTLHKEPHEIVADSFGTPPGPSKDIFIYANGGKYVPVEVFSDIENQFMSTESLERIYYTMKNLEATNKTRYDSIFDTAEAEVTRGTALVAGAGGTLEAYGTVYNVRSFMLGELAKFLSIKVTRTNIEVLLSANIHVPFTMIVARPNMTYNVSSAYLMKAGRETGAMFVGFQNFMVSTNSIRKSIGGSWTLHSKAVTLEPMNIMGMEDIFVQKYIRGANTRWFNNDDLAEFKDFSGTFESPNSMIAMLLPETFRPHDDNILDIRGFNSYYTLSDQEMHPSASYYLQVLNIDQTNVFDPSRDPKDFESATYKANTIVYRGFYEHGDSFEIGTGHLGPYSYPGVGRTRDALNFVPLKEQYGSKFSTSMYAST